MTRLTEAAAEAVLRAEFPSARIASVWHVGNLVQVSLDNVSLVRDTFEEALAWLKARPVPAPPPPPPPPAPEPAPKAPRAAFDLAEWMRGVGDAREFDVDQARPAEVSEEDLSALLGGDEAKARAAISDIPKQRRAELTAVWTREKQDLRNKRLAGAATSDELAREQDVDRLLNLFSRVGES